jgi:hypothetical protein
MDNQFIGLVQGMSTQELKSKLQESSKNIKFLDCPDFAYNELMLSELKNRNAVTQDEIREFEGATIPPKPLKPLRYYEDRKTAIEIMHRLDQAETLPEIWQIRVEFLTNEIRSIRASAWKEAAALTIEMGKSVTGGYNNAAFDIAEVMTKKTQE